MEWVGLCKVIFSLATAIVSLVTAAIALKNSNHNSGEPKKNALKAKKILAMVLVILLVAGREFFVFKFYGPRPKEIEESQTLQAFGMSEFFDPGNMDEMYREGYDSAISRRDRAISTLLFKEDGIHFTDEQHSMIDSDEFLRSYYKSYGANNSPSNARDMADRAETLAGEAGEGSDFYNPEKWLELARNCAIRMMVHALSQDDYYFHEGTLRLGILTYKIARLHDKNGEREPYLLAAVVCYEKCLEWMTKSHSQYYIVLRDAANAQTNLSDAYNDNKDTDSSIACAKAAERHFQNLMNAGQFNSGDSDSVSRMQKRANS